MKNIYIYLFFFLIYSLSSICQTNEAIKLTYRITNYLDLIATGTSEVYILNEEKKSINVLSKYTYKKSKHTLDDAIYTLPKSKDANFIYITDLRNNKLISKENTIDEFFYIKEPITIQKWELLDEFKTLNDVKLQKATTTFRGRNYTAWVDLNTPISQGPWKFNNLPGLAYEIFDDALDYHFEWQLIKILEPKEYDFASYDFSKEKFITQQDFIKTLDYFYKTNEDIASTRLLETLDVEVLGVTHHKINYRIRQKEKKYEWEE